MGVLVCMEKGVGFLPSLPNLVFWEDKNEGVWSMQLIIHGLTSHEKQENKSSASNQGPIPHQARSPRLATPLRCHAKK